MTLLDGLARYLATQALCTFDPTGAAEAADWSAYVEHLPQQPDRVIGLWQYAGRESDSRNPWDEVNVQVRVRGDTDPRTSRVRAQAIHDALHGLGPLTLPDLTWLQLAICTQAGPIPIGPDQSNRHEHTVNFRVEVDNPSALRPA